MNKLDSKLESIITIQTSDKGKYSPYMGKEKTRNDKNFRSGSAINSINSPEGSR